MHHDLRGHVFLRVAPAATGVVHQVQLRLEIHHSRDPQFILHLYSHMFHLARAAAQPDAWQYPGANEHMQLRNNTL